MATTETNEQLVFDVRTLRLIIGALAFAFPAGVIALTGKITTSISASYHELQSRDVFVGFTFIIGALLISYKGHVLDPDPNEADTFWNSLRRYEEDWISTFGGFAAILTALYPTARDGFPMDPKAYVHTAGAFVLFAMVVYFCLVAFLRSVNEKLKAEDPVFVSLVPPRRWFVQVRLFLSIARKASSEYDRKVVSRKDGVKEAVSAAPKKAFNLWLAYGKKIARGYVYLVCGILIALTLLVFLLMVWRRPDLVTGTKFTYIIETISLVFFGIAWMTASQMEYLVQIQRWLQARRQKTPAAQQTGAA